MGHKIGEATLTSGNASSGNWSLSWQPTQSGTHKIIAIATDTLNVAGTASSIITAYGNQPPEVTFTSPSNNTQIDFGGNLTLTATVTDVNSTNPSLGNAVTSVEFLEFRHAYW